MEIYDFYQVVFKALRDTVIIVLATIPVVFSNLLLVLVGLEYGMVFKVKN